MGEKLRNLVLLLVALSAAIALGQGAKPLAGSTGQLNVPVRLRDHQFTLVGASFATRFVWSEGFAVADKDKKLLVLTYTVQNPGKADLQYDWSSISFTVVGADGTNYDYKNVAINPEKKTPLNLGLKPAQKITATTFVEVPSDDPIPKLIVRSYDESAPVVRYDLRGKVKKFTGIFSDAEGVKALSAGSVKMAQAGELGPFDVAIESFSEATLPDFAPEEGQKVFAATASVTNATLVDQQLDWSTFTILAKDQNGEDVEFKNAMLRAVGNQSFSAEVKPGQTVKVRFVFAASTDQKPTSLQFAWGGDSGRVVTVKLN